MGPQMARVVHLELTQHKNSDIELPLVHVQGAHPMSLQLSTADIDPLKGEVMANDCRRMLRSEGSFV